MTTTEGLPLFDNDWRKDPRVVEFEEFHKNNPHIYSAFKRFAREAKRVRNHYSARDIIHRIRWYTAIESKDKDGFKINNNWSPFYARMLQAEDPAFQDFFRNRKAAADEL
jgi:hypothetical protein